ncbi:MAG TPA: DUF2917 domain-containing protein [Burkholderiales bacterium]|nr:DUF2917 domain-containing protein [Burkholderiales bacterium]
MKLELTSGALRLARGQTLKLRDGVGSTICAREGAVWITEEKSRKDVVLEPGSCFRIGRPGLTLVQAVADASVTVADASVALN